jgi:hypothetical protein
LFTTGKSGQVEEKGKEKKKREKRGERRETCTRKTAGTQTIDWIQLNVSVIVVLIPQRAGVGYIYRW